MTEKALPPPCYGRFVVTTPHQCCANCQFWEPEEYSNTVRVIEDDVDDDSLGHCLRYPPDVLGDEVSDSHTPWTWHGSWCGEWQHAADRTLHMVDEQDG